MNEYEFLADRFETNRTHLRGVAYRMLGATSEAEDAVQEAWLHFSRADTSEVKNLRGWLTTVVARVCLDMLRSRESRREEPLDDYAPDQHGSEANESDPEHETVLADSVGLALLVVLDTLNPAERLAFVLHDIFGVSFGEIAPIVGRTPEATRQLASRARRRVRGAATDDSNTDLTRQREVVTAFLAASRSGNFDALLALLDPEVIVRADPAAVTMGGPGEVRGAAAVANFFSGRARAAQPALISGAIGAVWMQHRQPQVVFSFTIKHGKIVGIELIADQTRLNQFDVVVLKNK